MVRMDNLSAAIMTSRVFTGSSNGFQQAIPLVFAIMKISNQIF